MSDKLEDFVKRNRASFDSEEPPVMVWEGIKKRRSPVKKKGRVISLNSWAIAVAASVLLMAVAVIALQSRTIKSLKAEITEVEVPVTNEWTLPEELKELDGIYATQVSQTFDLLSSHPEEAQEVRDELSELDEEFDELKEELGAGFSRQEVVEAMIENYRFKLELLEQTLEHFKRNDKIITEDENVYM